MKIKNLLLLVLMVMLPALVACKSTQTQKGEEPHGLLKAFGLKGKVKKLFITEYNSSSDYSEGDRYCFFFDPEGNSYDGGETSIEATVGRSGFSFSIKDWKITSINTYVMMGSSLEYSVTQYDDQNRPSLVTGTGCGTTWPEETVDNIALIYSGSDSEGNYTNITFDSNNRAKEPFIKKLKVEIEYWPEDATMDDVPKPLTEADAIELIKKANVKDAAALTEEFKTVLDQADHMMSIIGDGDYVFIENDGDRTILSDGEVTSIPDIEVKIFSMTESDTKDKTEVMFYYAPVYDGKVYKEALNDNDYLTLAYFELVDGKWKIKDIGLQASWQSNINFAEYSVLSETKSSNEEQIKEIKSGEFMKRVKECFANDPELNTYVKKVKDYQDKYIK